LYNIYRDTGYAYSLNKDYETSEAFYRKAIMLKPELATAYIDIGYIYGFRQNFQDWASVLRKSLEIDSKNYDSYWAFAWLYEQSKQFQLAIDNYLVCARTATENSHVAFNTIAILYGI
jgi:Tfp pilus assembly protein PilF